jgi:hypothetical protein
MFEDLATGALERGKSGGVVVIPPSRKISETYAAQVGRVCTGHGR